MTNQPEMPWLRLYTKIIDNDKLRLLAFEDRWHYVAILCMKRKGDLEGAQNDLFHRRIGAKLGLSLQELDSLKKRLIDVDLIDKKWQPISWKSYQYKSDSSKNRTAQWRERVKNNRLKSNQNVTVTSHDRHSDGIVAHRDALDKDIDTTHRYTRSVTSDQQLIKNSKAEDLFFDEVESKFLHLPSDPNSPSEGK